MWTHLRSHEKGKNPLSEDHIIVHDIPELSKIVHHTLGDQEVSEELIRDVVLDMKIDRVNNEVVESSKKDQLVYLEATEVDESDVEEQR